jgi:hypothetical protein
VALNAVSGASFAMTSLLLAPPLGEYSPQVQGQKDRHERWRMVSDFREILLWSPLSSCLTCFPRGLVPITFEKVRKRRGKNEK